MYLKLTFDALGILYIKYDMRHCGLGLAENALVTAESGTYATPTDRPSFQLKKNPEHKDWLASAAEPGGDRVLSRVGKRMLFDSDIFSEFIVALACILVSDTQAAVHCFVTELSKLSICVSQSFSRLQ